jgi:filamentous hemagglutinin
MRWRELRGGRNAVENNYLSPAQEEQKKKELEECQDRYRCIFGTEAKWSLISAQQDVGLAVGVGGGIGLSAAETAEGLYELATNLPEVMAALKLLANSPEFRQQFSDSYFADLEKRATLLTQAYNDAGWQGSVTAGVEGGRFAVEKK